MAITTTPFYDCTFSSKPLWISAEDENNCKSLHREDYQQHFELKHIKAPSCRPKVWALLSTQNHLEHSSKPDGSAHPSTSSLPMPATKLKTIDDHNARCRFWRRSNKIEFGDHDKLQSCTTAYNSDFFPKKGERFTIERPVHHPIKCCTPIETHTLYSHSYGMPIVSDQVFTSHPLLRNDSMFCRAFCAFQNQSEKTDSQQQQQRDLGRPFQCETSYRTQFKSAGFDKGIDWLRRDLSCKAANRNRHAKTHTANGIACSTTTYRDNYKRLRQPSFISCTVPHNLNSMGYTTWNAGCQATRYLSAIPTVSSRNMPGNAAEVKLEPILEHNTSVFAKTT